MQNEKGQFAKHLAEQTGIRVYVVQKIKQSAQQTRNASARIVETTFIAALILSHRPSNLHILLFTLFRESLDTSFRRRSKLAIATTVISRSIPCIRNLIIQSMDVCTNRLNKV